MREIEPKISQIAMQTRQDQQILYRKQPFYDRTQLNDIDRNIKAQVCTLKFCWYFPLKFLFFAKLFSFLLFLNI